MFIRYDDPGFWENWPEEFRSYKYDLERFSENKAALFPLGDVADNPPAALALYLPPNAVLDRHSHDCVRFEIVAKGEICVGEEIYKPGDIMMSVPNVAYGPHIAGPEGVLTYEIFSNLKAAYQATFYFDGDDAPGQFYDFSLPGQMEQLAGDVSPASDAAEE